MPAVSELEPSELPELQRLALDYASGRAFAVIGSMLALDARCAGIVSGANETMLAQMRLAWWRDRLGEAVESRPVGDPVLDALGKSWGDRKAELLDLINGWEELLGDAPLCGHSIRNFAFGRASAFAGSAVLLGEGQVIDAASAAGNAFALGDLLTKVSSTEDRKAVVEYSAEVGIRHSPLPRSLRTLAVLGHFGRRAVDRRAGVLFGDRLSPVVLIRLGLFGR